MNAAISAAVAVDSRQPVANRALLIMRLSVMMQSFRVRLAVECGDAPGRRRKRTLVEPVLT
jgi:hypothetical protein